MRHCFLCMCMCVMVFVVVWLGLLLRDILAIGRKSTPDHECVRECLSLCVLSRHCTLCRHSCDPHLHFRHRSLQEGCSSGGSAGCGGVVPRGPRRQDRRGQAAVCPQAPWSRPALDLQIPRSGTYSCTCTCTCTCSCFCPCTCSYICICTCWIGRQDPSALCERGG